VMAADAHHQYHDKYLLTEFMVKTAIASQLNCFSFMGFTVEQLKQLRAWAETSAVSVRLRSEETCTFVREETREVEGPKRVEEVSSGGVLAAAFTSKVVTKVTEYFWSLTVKYELVAFRAVGAEDVDRISIVGRTASHEIKTSSKETPRPASVIPAVCHDVNVSWLFKSLGEDGTTPRFSMNRDDPKCATPRRNPDVAKALSHFVDFRNWADCVADYMDAIFSLDSELASAIRSEAKPVLIPVMPLLGDMDGDAVAQGDAAAAPADVAVAVTALLPDSALPAGSALLAVADVNLFLAEEQRGLVERQEELQKCLPRADAIATVAEATLRETAQHCVAVCEQLGSALDYVEQMLRTQLIAAIGKEVTPQDFAEYMRFHGRKLFAEAFQPIPFCFSVRRTNSHSPEGTVSVEQATGTGGQDEPVVTMVCKNPSPAPMTFPLSASANVTFGGDRFLHAWLQHSFSGSSGPRLTLAARARQFSSFIILAGQVTSSTTFDPKCAAIVQNRDELMIPLDASTIPTPKEFKDAIASLSPEMQAFAKAFRSMQLESTLFGVVLIQIKPQLEIVLNLPEDSLTKEIKLTQDLMRLFIEYQIPTDLLSFDAGDGGDGELVGAVNPAERLEAVRTHVKSIYDMIEQSKQEELGDRIQEETFRRPLEHMRAEALEEGAPVASIRKGMTLGAKKSMSLAAPVMMRGLCAAAPPATPESAPSTAAAPPPAPAPAHPPALAQQQTQQTQPAKQEQQDTAQMAGGAGSVDVGGRGQRDYTQVPKELDARFEKLDNDNCLRPTILKPGNVWSKREKKKLLADFTSRTLHGDEQRKEKNAAFDLLDALTKSGGLPVEHASLHILVAATHQFDKTVTETIVQDNVNPIDKVERSMLIMASTVHQETAAAIIQDGQRARVENTCPKLFELEDAA